jgi:hypothetical protein
MNKEIIKNLTILFEIDDYEEVMYPIIKAYFLWATGQETKLTKFDINDNLPQAKWLLGFTDKNIYVAPE